MSVIQLDKLPGEVIQELLSYIDDATTLCRLASTCSTFSCIIKESEAVWQCLFQKRWTKRIPLTDFCVAYQRRHTTDRRALKILQTLSGSVMQQQQSWSTLLGREHEDQNWRLLQSQEFSSNIYDLLKALCSSSSDKYPTLVAQEIDDLTRCLAAHGVLAINFREVLKQWHSLINSGKEDVLILEEGALLLAKSLQELDDLLKTNENSVVEQLDEIANELQRRLAAKNVSLENAEQVIRILNTILIDDMGFQGNAEDYYNVHNSSITKVLESRKGIPITLVVLYKCICRRVGMPVHVIGLPGHVVLGLSNGNGPPLFVDAFGGGQIMSLEDCQNIAASYGFLWQPDFLRPPPAQDVLERMICNIDKSLTWSTSFPNQSSLKMRLLSMVIHGRGNPGIDGFVASHTPPLELDARLFRRYNLISDERLNSIERQRALFHRY